MCVRCDLLLFDARTVFSSRFLVCCCCFLWLCTEALVDSEHCWKPIWSKFSPSTFRELTQHQEKQDMLAQALSQWANISFLLMALRCQIPVLNSFYWSSKPVDCVTVADTVCIWGHYFFFRLLNSRSKLEAGKKIFLEICTRDAYSAFTLDHYLIQGTFTSPSGTFQSFGLSEYSECTLDSGQGGGAAVPSNVYTNSQMGAI